VGFLFPFPPETAIGIDARQATVSLLSSVVKRAVARFTTKKRQVPVIFTSRTGREHSENAPSNGLNPVLTSWLKSPQQTAQQTFPAITVGALAFSSCF
jgi:hypothetical protein